MPSREKKEQSLEQDNDTETEPVTYKIDRIGGHKQVPDENGIMCFVFLAIWSCVHGKQKGAIQRWMEDGAFHFIVFICIYLGAICTLCSSLST